MRITNRTGHLRKAGCPLCFSSPSAFAAPNEALPVSSVNFYSLLQPRHTYAGLHGLSRGAVGEAGLAGGYSGPGNSSGLLPIFAHGSNIPSKIAAFSSWSFYLPGTAHNFCLPKAAQRPLVLFILYESEFEECAGDWTDVLVFAVWHETLPSHPHWCLVTWSLGTRGLSFNSHGLFRGFVKYIKISDKHTTFDRAV